MYLKSLELHGFKSFPDRTLLKFNQGATIIVGPNGSGKSNITDAMRWVLGELSSKSIRGSKMEDVIFAGADDKKPMSFAEVSVTFDDSIPPKVLQSPYDEITVTRRYYRSGDSEYFINRKKVRLKDIYELFMNTGIGREGYSIIGQGKIAEIVSKKSDERRGVFEESAGIAKFRYKKNESEKKLAATQLNMERVGDIEQELAGRIGPLEKESEKARKFLELYDEKKKTDISLWIYDAARLKKLIEKTENDSKLSEHELEMAEDTANVISGKIERLFEQSQSNKEASRRNYEEASGAAKIMNAAESESKMLAKDKINSEKQLEREQILLAASSSSLEQEDEKLNLITSRLNEIKENKEKCEKQFEEINKLVAETEGKISEKNEALDSLWDEKQSAENRLTDLRVRLNVLENSIKNDAQRRESIYGDMEKYRKEIESLESIANSAQKAVDGYQKEIDRIVAASEAYISQVSGLNSELEEKDIIFRRKQAEVDSFDSRINTLTNMFDHFEGYFYSVRHIMNEAKNGTLKGIRGPISHLIKVDSSYIIAIETALGSALQNIVTDNEESAKKCIELLKNDKAGRATFYPVSTIKAVERNSEQNGVEAFAGFVGWGDSIVRCDSEYSAIIKSLLSKVAVFDTLDHAASAAKNKNWKLRAVTLDGQQINVGGSLTGGQAKKESGALTVSSEIETLKKKREEALVELNRIKEEINALRQKTEKLNGENKDSQERKSLIEALMSAENKTLLDAEGRKTALDDLLKGMQNDADSLQKSSSSSSDDLNNLSLLIEAENEEIVRITSLREEVGIERGELELLLSEKQEELNRTRITLAELSRDEEAALTSLSETQERKNIIDEDIRSHKENVNQLTNQIKTLAEDAENKLKEADTLKTKIDDLSKLRQKLDETSDVIEKQISELRQAEKEHNAKKDVIFMAHSKNVSKLESLRNDEEKLSNKIWDDYELTYSSAVKFAEEADCHVIEEGERTQFVTRQTELKNKIKNLGHVNVDAINEYKEVKERYEYIKNQLDDLRASKSELEKIISEIETEMTAMFTDAFGKINTYFGEVFRELFGGGHAEVVLSDPEHPLESGIEINAAPPGKTIKNLNLLSGGEQAFIAIALLFALIKVNPSPFCIFDEIEAALDEVNVTRVGRYVKRYSKEMQIIMISHRRGTMDIADTLYGVTMPQSGVSKVFTLGAADDKEVYLK